MIFDSIKVSSSIAIVSSLGLGLSGYLAYMDAKELEKMEATNVYSPSSLIENIQKHPESLQTLKRNPYDPNEYSLPTFIEGYVDCDKPVISEMDGKTRLIYRRAFKTDLYSNESISEAKEFSPIQSVETSKPSTPQLFGLKDALTDDVCVVQGNLDVDAIGAVERINYRTQTRKLGVVQKILVQFGKFLDLASSMLRNIIVVKGIYIGWTETELGITVGSALTVYGEVCYNSKLNSLRINTPLYFLKDKATLLKRLTVRLGKSKIAFYLFLVAFTLSTSVVLSKLRENYRITKRLREEQEWDRVEKAKFINLEDEYKCVICLERPRNVILKPCMHFALCRRCYNSLHKNVCPMCKKLVIDTIAVSLPS